MAWMGVREGEREREREGGRGRGRGREREADAKRSGVHRKNNATQMNM